MGGWCFIVRMIPCTPASSLARSRQEVAQCVAERTTARLGLAFRALDMGLAVLIASIVVLAIAVLPVLYAVLVVCGFLLTYG